ncbi:MAG: NifB/NifX family molybdenum-iron cluster-binding protein [Candidatus Micrarchaeia archaeon]
MAIKKPSKGLLVALCCDGVWPGCKIHPNFGRCSVFNFVMAGKGGAKLLESVPNPFVDSPGAGISAASFLAEKGAQAAVAGQFGPNASGALSKWGIRTVEAKGAAEKAIEKVKA